MSDIIYKYTDRDGIIKILQNGTLKFASPQDLNDPFDVYVHDLSTVDPEIFILEIHLNIFKQSPETVAQVLKDDSDQITEILNHFKKILAAWKNLLTSKLKGMGII